MEPDVKVEIVKEGQKERCRRVCYSHRNDSSTIRKCRDEIDPNLHKYDDVGHTVLAQVRTLAHVVTSCYLGWPM